MLKPYTRSRIVFLLFVMLALLTLFLSSLPVQTGQAASGCQVIYTPHPWDTGLTAEVQIVNNNTTAISGWTLTWSFANGQQITGSWNATVTQSGANVTASNPAGHWNGTIGANGGSVSFGFQGTHTGTNDIPTNFALNGVACGDTTATDTPTPMTETPAYGYFPDLIIASVTFNYGAENGCVMPGKRGFTAVVENIGIADASAFSVSLNGVVATVPGLEVGKPIEIFFAGINTTNAQGIAIADSTNVIGELYERNNQLTFPIPVITDLPPCTPTPTSTPSVGPDLSVSWIATTVRGIYVCGGPLYLQLSVAIRNQGTADAGPFEVDLNGQYRVTVPGVAAGAYAAANFPNYSSISNTATVDVTNTVAETEENNNSMTQMMSNLPTPPPCITPTATGTCTNSVIQAEAASSRGGGAFFDRNSSGYTGSGFVNFPPNGGYVQFNNVNGGSNSGNGTLRIRYALGASASRIGQLTVNGVIQNITFTPTGSWNVWAVKELTIPLTAGATNTLRIQSTGQDLANIDQIEVVTCSGATLTPSPTVTLPCGTYTPGRPTPAACGVPVTIIPPP
jgi:hypothetical protein